MNKFKGAYRSAPYFAEAFSLIEQIVLYDDRNLFRFLHNSIIRICEYLGIMTEIKISSEIAIDHYLKNQEKVLALCKAVGAKIYVNAIGGLDLYARGDFLERSIEL